MRAGRETGLLLPPKEAPEENVSQVGRQHAHARALTLVPEWAAHPRSP